MCWPLALAASWYQFILVSRHEEGQERVRSTPWAECWGGEDPRQTAGAGRADEGPRSWEGDASTERKEGARRRQREVPAPPPFLMMSTVPSGPWLTDSSFPLEQSGPSSTSQLRGPKQTLGEKTVCLFIESRVAQTVKNLPAIQETQVRSLSRDDPLEKGMATHSSILAGRIPWREEPDSPWGHKVLDTTEQLTLSLFREQSKGTTSPLRRESRAGQPHTPSHPRYGGDTPKDAGSPPCRTPGDGRSAARSRPAPSNSPWACQGGTVGSCKGFHHNEQIQDTDSIVGHWALVSRLGLPGAMTIHG